MKSSKKRGSGLLEIVIVVSLVSLVIAATTAAAQLYITYSIRNTSNIKASYLLEEGVEAAKIIRDTSWSANIQPLTLGSTRYIDFQSNTWNLTTWPNMVDGKYLRTIKFDPAYRDGNDDLSESSGTLQPNARYITISVSWFDVVSKATTTKTVSTFLINLFEN